MTYQPLYVNEYRPRSIFELLIPNERYIRLNSVRESFRPWNWNTELNYNQLESTIRRTNSKLQINVDVQHFAPEEISVKVVDGSVIVEANHDEKQDMHGYIARQFIRRYTLPEDCNPDLVESKLSSDGVLSITAQRSCPDAKNEKAVPITQTGPVRKEIKDDNPLVVSNDSEK